MDIQDLKTMLKANFDRSGGSAKLSAPTDIPPLSYPPQNTTHSDIANITGDICFDSRQVTQGSVFVAIRGTNVDGHNYIPQAIKRGARVIVAQNNANIPEILANTPSTSTNTPSTADGTGSKSSKVRLITVQDTSLVLAELAQAANGYPDKQLCCLGVTGTNGKTTVAWLTRAILNAHDAANNDDAKSTPTEQPKPRCGLIGTINYDLGYETISADNTTPDAVRLASMMRKMCDNGLNTVIMECSSHALAQNRTAGINFNAAAFTNLTGDHLDYHKTQEAYLAAKKKLFESLNTNAIVILNAHDTASYEIARGCKANIWYYGIRDDIVNSSVETDRELSHRELSSQNDKCRLTISAQVEQMGLRGCRFELDILGQKRMVSCPLIGRHNISNVLAAAGLAKAAGVDIDTIVRAVGVFSGVPGRLERIDCGQDYFVFVDYAHTDDALAHVLQTLKALARGRLILVFGCGGQRDRTKRPRMARVAQQYANIIVVTNDNPRNEDPLEIIADIRKGFSHKGRDKVAEIPDRRKAIIYALQQAGKNDTVLIAGKGHETYQLVGDKVLHFDDREVVRETIANQQDKTGKLNRDEYKHQMGNMEIAGKQS